MKAGRFVSWEARRHFHAVVWKMVLRQCWSLVVILAIYSAVIWVGELGWSRWFIYGSALMVAVMFGTQLGRTYEGFETHISQQIAIRRAKDYIRGRLIEDGATEEQADTALWQMDLDMDGASPENPE